MEKCFSFFKRCLVEAHVKGHASSYTSVGVGSFQAGRTAFHSISHHHCQVACPSGQPLTSPAAHDCITVRMAVDQFGAKTDEEHAMPTHEREQQASFSLEEGSAMAARQQETQRRRPATDGAPRSQPSFVIRRLHTHRSSFSFPPSREDDTAPLNMPTGYILCSQLCFSRGEEVSAEGFRRRGFLREARFSLPRAWPSPSLPKSNSHGSSLMMDD